MERPGEQRGVNATTSMGGTAVEPVAVSSSYAAVVWRQPAPLPSTRFAGRVQRPNTVVFHIQAFKDINSREVMEAVLKCIDQSAIESIQVPGRRYHLTFRKAELKEYSGTCI